MDIASAEETLENIHRLGGEGYYYRVNLTNRGELTRVLKKVKTDHGVPNIIINNAGRVSGKLLKDMTLDDYMLTVDVNYIAPVIITKFFLDDFIKRDTGHIFDVCSVVGFTSNIYSSEYAASKHALRAFHTSLRNEF